MLLLALAFTFLEILYRPRSTEASGGFKESFAFVGENGCESVVAVVVVLSVIALTLVLLLESFRIKSWPLFGVEGERMRGL